MGQNTPRTTLRYRARLLSLPQLLIFSRTLGGMVPFIMIISLSGKEKWLPFDDQSGAVQMIKNSKCDLQELVDTWVCLCFTHRSAFYTSQGYSSRTHRSILAIPELMTYRDTTPLRGTVPYQPCGQGCSVSVLHQVFG